MQVSNRQQIFDMVNFELNKKINNLKSETTNDNESLQNHNLMRGIGSNGTIHANSSFNLDEIPIPVNLNFTNSIGNSSVEIKDTPAMTKANNSTEQ